MPWVIDGEPVVNEHGEALLVIENAFRVGTVRLWKSGAPFAEARRASIVPPIRVPVRRLRGYRGPLVELLDVGIPLMSARLVTALGAAGVTTLELFGAVLVDEAGDEEAAFAFNVTARGPLTSDALLFRLEDNASTLLVHERVKLELERQGFSRLRFVRPDAWVQV